MAALSRNYALVTAGYWAFTITDGALRLAVLLHFHELGYSTVSLAFLFLLYEVMGIVTNLIGGWVGSRAGLHRVLLSGLTLQVVALLVLTVRQPSWSELVSVMFVMGVQAVSGVAKDLTKTSSKSAVKFEASSVDGALFRLVAILTGSKNALKGVGFFVGAALLSQVGYESALRLMAAVLAVVAMVLAGFLTDDLGRSKVRTPLRSVLSKSPAINRLATARFFLFGARDIWFVVALPVFLDEQLGWSFEAIGAFLAAWVIGYGVVQTLAPRVLAFFGSIDEVKSAQVWALLLTAVSAAIALMVAVDVGTTVAVVGGLIVFGAVFAVNSSLHSYLILGYASDESVALDVGFYYSANAAGRLAGTLLSGLLYLLGGLAGALWGSLVFVAVTWLLSLRLAPLPSTGRQAPNPRLA